MKLASSFRSIARKSLRNNWRTAILTGFLATLLGAGVATVNSGSIINSDTITELLQDTNIPQSILSLLFVISILTLVWSIIMLVVSGATKLGYAIYNLQLVDKKKATLSSLFSQINRLGGGFCMNLLLAIFTVLWTLLFIVPGIIKCFSYAMTPYIYAENPDISVTDAITKSKQLMNGNKWRLFCLDISFIGWTLLCAIPPLTVIWLFFNMVVWNGNVDALFWLIPCYPLSFAGFLFLKPYVEVATAAFYRDITTPSVPAKRVVIDTDSFFANDTSNTNNHF